MKKQDFDLPPLELIKSDDDRFMYQALKEAKKAFLADEVPVGAVVVYQGQVISRGHNQVELLRDATAHAEMLAMTGAASSLGNWRLAECTLYCTLEPCIMCAGAAILSRLEKIVWAAPDLRHGGNGGWINLFEKPHPIHRVTITNGPLAIWSEQAMKLFFQKKRKGKA